MSKIIDLKSSLVFIVVTLSLGLILSLLSNLGFFSSCAIVGGAILFNGLVIAVLEDKNE
ncbi:hypothetical protein [Microbulbifer discodermiae]|uniref:hypothetical protein n=1 Tax=Microbulbifer sp. 2201CG32-9 TaxID=3232309 RepID=UPI00345C0C90